MHEITEEIIDAVMDVDRYAPKIIPMGANPPLFDGMQIDNDGCWVSHVAVAKKLRATLSALPPEGESVKVKALEWGKDDAENWSASSLLGAYNVFCDAQTYSPVTAYIAENTQGFIEQCATLEDAKAAAQADFNTHILSALEASQQAEAREGWKLVPIEPTIKMIDAGDDRQFGNGPDIVRHIYRAMLAAAPSEPGETKP